MARQEQSPRLDTRSARPSSLQPRVLYLTAYNLLFAALWVSVGVSALTHVSKGRFVLFQNVEPLARWVQTLTLIEVMHAGIGRLSLVLPILASLTLQAL
jgi:very-long-chain (3R)-3-hydroxyacyl-CoA dehydratase